MDRLRKPHGKGTIMAETEELLKKRLIESANKAYHNNCYTFTSFLGELEQDLFFQIEKEISFIPYLLFGGATSSERRMIRFGSEELFGYEEAFPIACILVRPLNQKFADQFTHRDFLGAVMNLGIERSEVGDIMIMNNEGYLFVTENMSDYIMMHLDQVKHTHVTCSRTDVPRELMHASLSEICVTAASKRLDGIISKIYGLSRNTALTLFSTKKVFVNGRQTENNSYQVKEQDTVSVRGYGKFQILALGGITKKGKLQIKAGIYGNTTGKGEKL
ncbi:MAG: hypothetical protein GX567_05915 [Clostridia bacterium]|nr:hypothetical protein [Clostridia bacterium]